MNSGGRGQNAARVGVNVTQRGWRSAAAGMPSCWVSLAISYERREAVDPGRPRAEKGAAADNGTKYSILYCTVVLYITNI